MKKKQEVMSRGEFKVFLSDLIDHYDGFQSSILEFLESEGVTKETIGQVNPLDIVLEIDELNRSGKIFVEVGGLKAMSDTLIILCGLSELIAAKLNEGRFQAGDIVYEKRSGVAYFVQSVDANGYFLMKSNVPDTIYVNFKESNKFKKLGKKEGV